MRNTIFALATSALLAGAVFVGCGDNGGTEVGDMAGDMATGTKPDMTTAAKIGCDAYVDCINACQSAGSQAEYDACVQKCDKSAKTGVTSTSGTGTYDKALACGQLYCLGDVDAMSGKCKLSADGSQLTNADGSAIAQGDPGTGMKACGACLNNALAGLFKETCKDTSSPDCNPAQCKSFTSACLNDK